MLAIYDTEDCNPSANPPPFLQRTVATMSYVRTDCFDQTIMQNWVRKKDGVPIVDKKNWVYNHYVPHSRIQKAIENYITQNTMTREDAIKWLINVTANLKITVDESLASTNWGDSRVKYDVWADWAVSAICDWKKNIFYGPGSGDDKGTSLDKPTDPKQFDRVQKAAAKLAQQIPSDSLLVDKIPAEKVLGVDGDEDAEPLVREAQSAAEAAELVRQVLDIQNLIAEDAGDDDWVPGEPDPVDLFPIPNKNWKKADRVVRKVNFKKSGGYSPYQTAKGKK